jgi:hypothetical protein
MAAVFFRAPDVGPAGEALGDQRFVVHANGIAD